MRESSEHYYCPAHDIAWAKYLGRECPKCLECRLADHHGRMEKLGDGFAWCPLCGRQEKGK